MRPPVLARLMFLVLNPVESPANLLRLSPKERDAGNSELLWVGFGNADDNGPSNRDGNNGSYDGKHKACSNKRA